MTTFPAGCNPQVPVSDRRYYPMYQTCIDLDLPIMVNAGIAGPRVPSACQDVMHFDQVCYDFPELRIVMRHGAEPWEELAVKLMLKWPGLHYMTSAFAPKYYPKAIIDYANTRGADKVMYAGYYPWASAWSGSSPSCPTCRCDDHVWPSSCARTRCGCSSSTTEGASARHAPQVVRWARFPRRPCRGCGRIGPPTNQASSARRCPVSARRSGSVVTVRRSSRATYSSGHSVGS